MYIANHYIPKPGGGVTVPGEVLSDKFTAKQVESLLKSGAIRLADEPVPDAPADETPMEIDAMEGVVQTDPPKKRRRKA